MTGFLSVWSIKKNPDFNPDSNKDSPDIHVVSLHESRPATIIISLLSWWYTAHFPLGDLRLLQNQNQNLQRRPPKDQPTGSGHAILGALL